MAFRRLYPTKDTFVANGEGLKDISAMNAGASEILHLYKQVTGALAGPNLSHIMMAFDTSSLPATGTATASWTLHLSDAQHSGTLPAGYEATILPVTQDWAEGQGHDLDAYTDAGFANWFSASSLQAWSIPGGWPDLALVSGSASFQTGHEDLVADVTPVVTATYGIPFGFFIGLSGALVSDNNDYYIKKFHSRHTHFVTKKPFMQISWADWTGSLSTSSFYVGTSGAYSGTVVPSWATGTISASLVTVTNSLVDPTGALVSTMPLLKPVYFAEETVRMRLYVRPFDYSPATVATASAEPSGTVLMDAYYRIVNGGSGEVLVPFDVAGQSTKLSWDDTGNYFDIHMGSLPTGTIMRFDYLYNVGTSTSIISGSEFTFRIE